MPLTDAELAREFGLDSVPQPRVSVPQRTPPIPSWFKPKFFKALQLVDQIETWAFERFIPAGCVIDQSIDARILTDDIELHAAVLVRTDMPPPSNDLIWRATGVKPSGHPEAMSTENFYRWLAIEVANEYRRIGARAMGVPLIFRTKGDPKNPVVVPYVGAICKFDRRPPDGRTRADMVAGVGVLVPAETPLRDDHKVTVLMDEPKDPT
jgi:hypothetical protein